MTTEAEANIPRPPIGAAIFGTHGFPEPQLLVRVLGRPSIPSRPALRGKELELAVYLACQQGPVSVDAVRHALWQGRPGNRKRALNLVSATRRALGELDDGLPAFPASKGSRCGLRLAAGVSTDLDLLRACLVRSTDTGSQLHDVYRLVEGPPFDGPGYEWAHHADLLVAEASTLIEDAAWRLADPGQAIPDVGRARRTVRRGLRALPGNESLYRLRMRVEHQAGNVAAVHAAYRELCSYLDEIDIGAGPSAPTVALHRQLTGPDRLPERFLKAADR